MYIKYISLYFGLNLAFQPVLSQMCKDDSLGGHVCDQTVHILHHDYEVIRRYCGKIAMNIDTVTSFLTNGKDARTGEVPFLGSLIYHREPQCGVILIDNMHVVTAAHCVILKAAYDERIQPRDLTVVFGTNIRYNVHFNDPDAVEKMVDSFVKHRGYQREDQNRYGAYAGKDLAILTLTDPVEFSSTIRPICVGTPSDKLGHMNMNPIMLAGFGRDRHNYKKVLQISKNLKLLTEQECSAQLTEKYNKKLHDGQMCTSPSDPLTGK